MPFKSEAQRRYLWANEPEIARDWADTYGSRIQAALGGIMASRAGFRFGGNPHEATQGSTNAGQTSGPTGGNKRGGEVDRMLTHKFAVEKPTIGMRTGDFFSDVGTGIKDYITGGGMIGAGIRGLKDVFGKFGSGWNTTMGPRKDMGYNPNRVNPFSKPDGGGNRPYILPQYNWDDLYAQNVMEEDDIDIDTSTGDMEDWSQRFRVDDQYRQDQGALDEQIREYISTLYT